MAIAKNFCAGKIQLRRLSNSGDCRDEYPDGYRGGTASLFTANLLLRTSHWVARRMSMSTLALAEAARPEATTRVFLLACLIASAPHGHSQLDHQEV